jgi:hypothetical protein
MKSDALYDLMDDAIRKALAQLRISDSRAAIVDLYIQPNPEAGEFAILDDEDHLLIKVPVSEWQEKYDTIDVDAELQNAEKMLRTIVEKVKEEGAFDTLNILKPFSVLLVDDEMETIAELLLIDDEQFMLDDTFLKNLDQDLDDFFQELMSDI